MRQAIAYFTASGDGLSSEEAASQMIRHVLRYALKMDI